MIRCHNCNHEEPPGALFCGECGVKLLPHKKQEDFGSEAGRRSPFEGSGLRVPMGEYTAPLAPPTSELQKSVSLQIVDVAEEIPLEGRNEFTLGRVTEGQPLIPEVDLGPYNAYEKGVSRLHAVIGIREKKIVITDLGSANGTRVNGVRISPHTPHALANGDLVALGKLELKALIQ